MKTREIDAIRVNDIDPMLDRRRKLTPEDKIEILEGHSMGMSINKLAAFFDVSRRTIQFILFPDRLKENLERRRERGGSMLYYSKETNKKRMQGHRAYKKHILQEYDENG